MMNTPKFDEGRGFIWEVLNKLSDQDIQLLCRILECEPHYNFQDKPTRINYLIDEIRNWRSEADAAARFREGLRLLGVKPG